MFRGSKKTANYSVVHSKPKEEIMSITNYSELQSSVAGWLARNDMAGIIPDLIRMAERRINRELRIRAMEESLNTQIANGAISVPADYMELKHAYLEGNPTTWLGRKSIEFIYQKYPSRNADSKPGYIAREGDQFIFGPYPDANYTVKGIYYKGFDTLSDASPTNWLITNAPDLLLFGALAEAEAYIMNDQRIMVWENKYQAVRDQIIAEDKRETNSGSILSARVG